MLRESRPSYPLMPYLICGLASLFYVYDYFIQVAPSVMTHQLMKELSIGAASLGILSACFYYSYTLMQIPAGMLIDRFGARKLLSSAVLTTAIGVTLFGSSHSFYSIAFSRFLIGLGSSFAFISALFLAARWFHHRHFTMIAGLVQLGGAIGSIIGLAPLAYAINYFGWRETMITTGIFTFALAIVYWFVIRDGEPIDSSSSKTNQQERNHLMAVIKIPQVWWIALAAFVCWIPVATVGALWGVPYLMKVYQWTNSTAANVCSWLWIGLGIGSPLIGWLSDHVYSRRQPMIWCFWSALAGSIILLLAPYLPYFVTGVGIFLLGFSASIQSLSFGIIKDNVPTKIFGTASGFNNMAAIAGGGVSQPLVGFILYWQWNGLKIDDLPIYTVHNYQMAFLILPIAAVIGLFTTWCKVKETGCRNKIEGQKY